MQSGVVVYHCELHGGVHKSHALELMHYVAQFNAVFLEESAASGRVEEQVLHHKVCSRSADHGFLCFESRFRNSEASAYLVVAPHRAHVDLRHRSNGGESFAAESHGMEAVEIGSRGYFAGGMPFECHAGVGRTHPASVVDNLYQRTAGILHHNGNGRGAGIDGIFHQLFYNRGRTLDNFSCRNLVGDGVRQ